MEMICHGVLHQIVSMHLFMMMKWSLDVQFVRNIIVWLVGFHFIKARHAKNIKLLTQRMRMILSLRSLLKVINLRCALSVNFG